MNISTKDYNFILKPNIPVPSEGHQSGKELSITAKISQVGLTVFSILNAICDDPDLMIHVFGKLQAQILPYLELKKGRLDHYHHLKGVMHSGCNIFTSLQVFTSADYFINSKFKKDHSSKVAAHGFLFAARASACSKWLLQTGLTSLGKVSATIGKTRLLNGLNVFSLSLFGIANLFFAGDALAHALASKTCIGSNYGKFEFVKNMAEFGIHAMLLFGGLSPSGLCILGCMSLMFGVSSVYYKRQHKCELDFPCQPSIMGQPS